MCFYGPRGTPGAIWVNDSLSFIDYWLRNLLFSSEKSLPTIIMIPWPLSDETCADGQLRLGFYFYLKIIYSILVN